MYGVILEYPAGEPPPALRRYRAALAGRPGYRRRLELQADGYRRLIDLYLFDAPEAAVAALDAVAGWAGAPWPPGFGLALLVREGGVPGLGPATLLRRAWAASPDGGPPYWRERLDLVTPEVELW